MRDGFIPAQDRGREARTSKLALILGTERGSWHRVAPAAGPTTKLSPSCPLPAAGAAHSGGFRGRCWLNKPCSV